ncbi:T9SS type A sorting domain-containing protein [bacterium]|nr:T9SS type A sorting domain-containing protein [bacterium]
MRRYLAAIVCVLTFLSAAYSSSFKEIANENALETESVIQAHNDYITVQLKTTTGRFNIGTYPDNKSLTYFFPSPPWSSWVIVRVDGVSYVCPEPDPIKVGPPVTQMNISRSFSVLAWPTNLDSSYIFGAWSIPGISRLEVRQILQPVYLVYPDDTTGSIFIKYVIINNSTSIHDVGVLLLLDTDVDSNDEAPVGTNLDYSRIERDFYNCDTCEFPCYWFAYGDPRGPLGPPDQVVAMGILCGFDAVPPDRFAIGDWRRVGGLFRVQWSFFPSGANYGDSGVLLWWFPRTLYPGDTLVVATYFGLGKPVPGEISINIPEYPRVVDCSYQPDSFSVMVFFTNGLDMRLRDLRATIILPTGLRLSSVSDDTVALGPDDLYPGQTGSAGWYVIIDSIISYSESICVQIFPASGDTSFTDCVELHLTPLHPPTAELVYPDSGAVSSCQLGQILYRITVDSLAQLVFTLDGDTIPLSDPHLRIVGDSLLMYIPDTTWANGVTHTFGILRIVDQNDCRLDSVMGSFFTDFRPPVVRGFFPKPETIITTQFDSAGLIIRDLERTVDESTIVFVANGDTYTISDPQLTFYDSVLTFSLSSAGIVLSDGDTICFALVDAADPEPDYCDANHIDSVYRWCIYYRIVDLFLPETTANAGDIIDIPIIVDDITDLQLRNFRIRLSYSPSVLTPLGVESIDALVDGWTDLSLSVLAPGTLEVSCSGFPINGSGALVFVRFMVTSRMATFTPLRFIDVSLNDGTIGYKTHDGLLLVPWNDECWSVTINISATNISKRHLLIGLSPYASDSFDAGIDVISPLPSPSEFNLYIEPPVAEPFIDRLMHDFRNCSDSAATWKIHAYSPRSTDTIWFRWSRSGMPQGMLMLTYVTSAGTTILDMKKDTSFMVLGGTDVTIEYFRGVFTALDITLCPGWNLISLPVAPTTTTELLSIIPNAASYPYWYNPALRTYQVLDTVSYTHGFWIYMSDSSRIRIYGAKLRDMMMPLSAGWNLVGVPYKSDGFVPITSITTMPPGAISLPMYYFNACSSDTYIADTTGMKVGYGYWVLATDDCELILHGSAKVGAMLPGSPEFAMDLDVDGRTLELAVDSRAKDGLDRFDIAIPPSPVFEERTEPAFVSDGVMLRRDARPGGKYELSLRTGAVVKWDAKLLPENLDFILIDGEERVNMRELSSWVAGNERLYIEVSSLPRELSIKSISPNPFNSVARIKFVLPEDLSVSVEVYDINGRLVRILARGKFGAGENEIIWDGTDEFGNNLPSGIYMITLKCGDKVISARALITR